MAAEIVDGSIVASASNVGDTTPVTLADYVIGSTGANTALVVLIHSAKRAETISSVTWR